MYSELPFYISTITESAPDQITIVLATLVVYLHDGDDAGDHDDEVGQPPVVSQTPRDYAER